MTQVLLGMTTLVSFMVPADVCPEDAQAGWISLFNGKDLSGWTPYDPNVSKWVVENGEMINKGRGCDIYGGPKLRDFQLHVEFAVPKRSNAGVYLRGHYEIQVLDDFGQKPSDGSAGGIYGQCTPRVNASFPPGEWQTYDAILIGDTVTVLHNGVCVIKSKKLTGKTGASMDGNHMDPGPLMIQGDHGPVKLRNILIRPMKEGDAIVPFPAKTGFTRLFDGKTLNGWTPSKTGHGTGGKWEVVDGAIAGDQDKPGNGGIIISEQKYGDFELTADVRPDWGCDSGLFLRSTPDGRCYQIMVDYYGGGNIGGIYGEGTGGFNFRNYDFSPDKLPVPKPDAQVKFPEGSQNTLVFTDDWNHIRARVTANPPTIDVWLNGTHITHYTDTEKRLEDTGHLALQVHGGQGWPMGSKTRFKQIEVMPLK